MYYILYYNVVVVVTRRDGLGEKAYVTSGTMSVGQGQGGREHGTGSGTPTTRARDEDTEQGQVDNLYYTHSSYAHNTYVLLNKLSSLNLWIKDTSISCIYMFFF